MCTSYKYIILCGRVGVCPKTVRPGAPRWDQFAFRPLNKGSDDTPRTYTRIEHVISHLKTVVKSTSFDFRTRNSMELQCMPASAYSMHFHAMLSFAGRTYPAGCHGLAHSASARPPAQRARRRAHDGRVWTRAPGPRHPPAPPIPPMPPIAHHCLPTLPIPPIPSLLIRVAGCVCSCHLSSST